MKHNALILYCLAFTSCTTFKADQGDWMPPEGEWVMFEITEKEDYCWPEIDISDVFEPYPFTLTRTDDGFLVEAEGEGRSFQCIVEEPDTDADHSEFVCDEVAWDLDLAALSPFYDAFGEGTMTQVSNYYGSNYQEHLSFNQDLTISCEGEACSAWAEMNETTFPCKATYVLSAWTQELHELALPMEQQ